MEADVYERLSVLKPELTCEPEHLVNLRVATANEPRKVIPGCA